MPTGAHGHATCWHNAVVTSERLCSDWQTKVVLLWSLFARERLSSPRQACQEAANAIALCGFRTLNSRSLRIGSTPAFFR